MNKNRNELRVQDFADSTRTYKVYRAISGTKAGDKEREGDMKIPEGIYLVEGKIPSARMR